MVEPVDPARYVPAAAAAVGLPLAPQELGNVIGAFAFLMRVAQVVMAFPLPEEVMAAAVFTAEEDGKR